MIYQWKDASHIKVNAQTAGAVFETLEKTVGLTPHNLLEASRPKNAPLHSEFEWNNAKAAEKYREAQAGHLIRCICVKPETSEEQPIRAYFKVESETYSNISIIQADSEKMSSLLDIAKKELAAFEQKYKALSELEPVFKAIKEVNL